ncbi:MAG: glycosyltransferase family 4 protein [Pseudomonadales bacterium]|nr:glycosyltransferase family 4 protein [Pseudomonadales bacterium]
MSGYAITQAGTLKNECSCIPLTPVKADLYFIIPGDLETLTGGYGYDRRLLAELTALGLAVEHLPLSGMFPAPDPGALADADRLLSALPDDAVVLIDGLAFGAMDTIIDKHRERLRIIALCHHPLAFETGLDKAQAQNLYLSERRALDAAMAVLATSTMTRQLLTRQFALAPEKITVASPGTDRHDFAECIGTPPVLLTVASLIRRKAHDVLIDALARISHLPWTARFVGGMDFDPDWTMHLRAMVAAAGLDKRIWFGGSVADLLPEYKGADLFVLPSLFEGYGMAFAEALASGLPVVAARAGAVPDLVPETAGLLVPPGDSHALAAVLDKLLTQPAVRGKLQRGARRAAGTLPTWADNAGIVADLITTVRSM